MIGKERNVRRKTPLKKVPSTSNSFQNAHTLEKSLQESFKPNNRGENEKKRVNLQPGVEALGYVNSTTPDLLSSRSSFKDVLSPSFVSISPPNPSKSILSPTVGTEPFDDGASTASAFLAGSFFGFAAGADAFALVVLVFFSGTGGGAGALRFLSSTTISLVSIYGLVDVVEVLTFDSATVV